MIFYDDTESLPTRPQLLLAQLAGTEDLEATVMPSKLSQNSHRDLYKINTVPWLEAISRTKGTL
jgi:hypothetical protein